MAHHFLSFPTGRNLKRRSRGYLPHWELDDSIYFITYRLADSLPRDVFDELRAEQRRIRAAMAKGRPLTSHEQAELRRQFGLRLDHHLDRGFGACHLRRPEIASLVTENLRHNSGGLYELLSWCVMPNHVHVLIHLARGNDLSRVICGWKSYTAHKAIALLDCEPPFWQAEYFDRIVRDERDYCETKSYILNNPAKAGLINWPWVGSID